MSEPKHPEPDFLPPDICPLLRTKSLALNTHYEPTVFEERAQSNVAVFYCMKTMGTFGPDDLDIGPDDCRCGRSCWSGEPEA